MGKIVSKHVSAITIERHRQRLLPPEELLELDDHLAGCETCRLQMASAFESGASTGLLAGLEGEAFEHPAYEQFEAYVDGLLDDFERELAESHFVCCAQCSGELLDLQLLKEQMALRTSAPAISPPSGRSSKARRSTLPERIAGLWNVRAFRIPMQLGAAAACLVVLAWAATIPLRKNIAELKGQLAESEQRNAELQREYDIARGDADDLQKQIAVLQAGNPNPAETVAIVLEDGKLKVDAQGNFAGLEGLPPTYEQIARNAMDTGQVKAPASIGTLAGRAGVLMGGANDGVAFALLSPIGTAVSSSRPTFRWQRVQGASGYVVTVLDMDFNVISKSPATISTSWAISDSLQRGQTYVWKVTAVKDGAPVNSPVPPAPEARFKVLEKERVDEVLKTRRDYSNSHLLSGLVYTQAGLLDDAEREFQGLARENPKSDVARKLLRNVKALRGR